MWLGIEEHQRQAELELPSFFARDGLGREGLDLCLQAVRKRYRDGRIEILAGQGGCSFTVVVNERVIVQFRLLHHAIPRRIAIDARQTYGDLVPRPVWFDVLPLKEIHLQVCGMSRIDGQSFSGIQPRRARLSKKDTRRLEILVVDLADFFAKAWHAAVQKARASCSGKVGRSVRERLVKMEENLPAPWLRERAFRLRKAVDQDFLARLPVVLNHGDFLPSNILVDRETWKLQGLVDWAEGEYLPFGMTLYGVEHLFGFMADGRFVYYHQACVLRKKFFTRLRELIPELDWEAMWISREIGIFLWHGIAWDDGKLDRVVNAVDDVEEVAYLEAFLSAEIDRRSRL